MYWVSNAFPCNECIFLYYYLVKAKPIIEPVELPI